MDDKTRKRVQLNCLYDMFCDRIEENVVYIVYTENDGNIDVTIDQLMSIAASSFTGHHFETTKLPLITQTLNNNSPTRKVLQSGGQTFETHNTSIDSSSTEPSSNGINNQLHEQPDETTLTLEERIEELQKSIVQLLEEKQISHDKARQYLAKKMYPVTSYYSDLSSQLKRIVDNKTKELVNLLLEKSKNSDKIDLHGLNPVQAQLVVSELLKQRQLKLHIDKQGEATIDIITGWGKHSVTQGQRIRPTIIALLREKKIRYEHVNRGALRVTIRR